MLHERTIDDLVGHVLANIVDRGGTHYADCEFDGQRHLVCVARTLAREVDRLRAERDALVAVLRAQDVEDKASIDDDVWRSLELYRALPEHLRNEIEADEPAGGDA